MLILLTIFLPLFLGITLYLIPNLSIRVIKALGSLIYFGGIISTIVLLIPVFENQQSTTISWNWLQIKDVLDISISLQTDIYGTSLALVIYILSFLVHNFSYHYLQIQYEKQYRRYVALLGLFVGTMLGLVLSDNLLLLFVFWELVGLSSYLLVGFWNAKESASLGALKAILYNRLGDIVFFAGILLVWSSYNTLGLNILYANKAKFPFEISLLLLTGVLSKSAQFPFLVWLPNAMTGPTPISSLLHAATMVAAGVFLSIRLYPFLDSVALLFLVIIGTISAVLGALSACMSYDIKKILAYSTISQLGLMVLTVGVGAPQFAFFHLLTHAFYKCLLFLSIANVLSLLHKIYKTPPLYNVQDIRFMGGLRRYIPHTFLIYLLAAAALVGLPFTAGFLSKEGILVSSIIWSYQKGKVSFIIPTAVFLTSILTAYYILRHGSLIFNGTFRGGPTIINGQLKNVNYTKHIKMSSLWLTFPLIFIFWIVWSPLKPLSTESFWLFSYLPKIAHHSNLIDLFALFTTILALFIGLISAHWSLKNQLWNNPIASGQVNFDIVEKIEYFYSQAIVKPFIFLANVIYYFDTYVLDKTVNGISNLFAGGTTKIKSLSYGIAYFDDKIVDLSVNSIAGVFFTSSFNFKKMYSGKIQTYLLWSLVLFIIFLLFILW